jgi:hypothetical protein
VILAVWAGVQDAHASSIGFVAAKPTEASLEERTRARHHSIQQDARHPRRQRGRGAVRPSGIVMVLSKLEGLNSKIRLINHRGYGHHSAAAVIAMIYLCCSGLTITLPTGR